MNTPTSSLLLPAPEAGNELEWVRLHLGHLCLEGPDAVIASPRWTGGQRAADDALANLRISGYAANRNEVWPAERRGATGLSPWIRHGLLQLPQLWEHVAGSPARDIEKFRDELMWQEYARHLYARLGKGLSHDLRAYAPRTNPGADPLSGGLRCVDALVSELHTDGWLVNQTRMWFAAHWSVRHGADWRDGEAEFFTHLLDGSRAANRLGWQWTVGCGTGKPYGFSRSQVEKRAPGMCAGCERRNSCPIDSWPRQYPTDWVANADSRLRSDRHLAATAGPAQPTTNRTPTSVWITAESLGDADPALAAHPTLPVVFVFDEELLSRLALSSKRLVFLAECLADLAERRDVSVYLGDPRTVLEGRSVATTFAPVPGWKRIATDHLGIAEVHPWPWLRQPHRGPIGSYTAWRKG
jgi:deoxyribodipyrimidine photo-lyase